MRLARKGLCVLAAILGLALVGGTALATEYRPCVSVGQYAKYGYSCTGEGSENLPLWLKLEVIAVSGGNITLRSTGQKTAEEAMPTSDSIWNVEMGTQDGNLMCVQFVMAGNLNKGDAIPPGDCELAIAKTETREYLGAKRTVNVMSGESEFLGKWTRVYDKESGMMLEYVTESDGTKVTISVIETNIFPSEAISKLPGAKSKSNVPLLAVAIVVVVVLVVVVLVVYKRPRGPGKA